MSKAVYGGEHEKKLFIRMFVVPLRTVLKFERFYVRFIMVFLCICHQTPATFFARKNIAWRLKTKLDKILVVTVFFHLFFSLFL